MAEFFSLRCRQCRTHLLVADNLKCSHEKTTESCGSCLYLDEDDLPQWIRDEIESSCWTKGRLYCTKKNCSARIGGFDYVQGLLCGCGAFTIPAVWIQDSKVDVNFGNKSSSRQRYPRETVLHDPLNRSRRDLSPKQGFNPFDINRGTTVATASGTPANNCITVAHTVSTDVAAGHENTNAPVDNGTLTVLSSHSERLSLSRCTKRNELRSKENYLDASVEALAWPHSHLTQNSCASKSHKPLNSLSANRFDALTVEEPDTKKPEFIPSPEAAYEHLICAVCLDYFYRPFECSCSHTFCKSCLQQLYHNRAGRLKCPICRRSVKYIEPAHALRQELHNLQIPGMKEREEFEKTAKYRKWPLPPVGPLPFLRQQQTLIPMQDWNLVKFAGILLLVVCYTMMYILT